LSINDVIKENNELKKRLNHLSGEIEIYQEENKSLINEMVILNGLVEENLKSEVNFMNI
jgi:predicted nuclease with TOPRIM domain